jgi:hypothetical protein
LPPFCPSVRPASDRELPAFLLLAIYTS